MAASASLVPPSPEHDGALENLETLQALMRIPENRRCADCSATRTPHSLSLQLSISLSLSNSLSLTLSLSSLWALL
jgi:hypothetical protein